MNDSPSPRYPEVKAVRAWAAHTLDVPESFIEPLQLVRYTEGQHLGAHVDWNDERDPGLWVFGQRMATMLVYLSTMPQGGESDWQFLNLASFMKCCRSIRPRKLEPSLKDKETELRSHLA